jgi:hypothetical protein
MKKAGERAAVGYSGAHRGSPKRSSDSATTLKQLGISKDQSSKWQQLAEIPKEEFEVELNKPGPPISTEGLLNSRILAADTTPRIDPQALWAWDRIKEFERQDPHALLTVDLYELFQAMTETMQEDLDRVAPRLIHWLSTFLDKRKGGLHGSNRATNGNSQS